MLWEMPQSGGKLRRSVQTARLCKSRSDRGPKFEHIPSCFATSRTYPTMQQCGLLRRAKGVHSSFRSSLFMGSAFLVCIARESSLQLPR